MAPEGPKSDRPSREDVRRQRRRAGHRRLAIAVSLLVLLLLAVGLTVGLTQSGVDNSAGTSLDEVSTTSTTQDSATSPSTPAPPATSGGSVATTSPSSGTTTPGSGSSTTASSSPSESSSMTNTTTGNATTSSTIAGTQSFVAGLDGGQEVPPVATQATGTLNLTVTPDQERVWYVLKVTDLSDLTIARLRQGSEGQQGEIIATITPDTSKKGSFTGVVAEGTLTEADLTGPLKGKTIKDLVALMKADQVYVNVGTSSNYGGEIRGQVEAVGPSDNG
jgi:hypothetical protein